MTKLKVLELFGGIGACTTALERLGIEHEVVDYVEIDKYAVKSYNAIHGTNFEPQDITTWNKNIDVDLVMHGSPCQDFSIAGVQAGGDEGSGTRSSLMYETLRIVERLKPKYVIWENVKNVLSKQHLHNFEKYIKKLEELGYTSYYKVLNAKDYGVPQHRERIFVVSIRNDIDKRYEFPKQVELERHMGDILENNVDNKYYLSDKMINYISATGTENFHNHDAKINLDIARPVTTMPNKRAGTTNYISEQLPLNYDLNVIRKYGIFDTDTSKHQAGSVYDTNGLSPTLDTMQGGYRQPCIETKLIRRLTPRECWRLMSFSDDDFDKAKSTGNSDTQLYKQAGNSIVVNVLEKVLEALLND